jgi:hypothetical protein
MSNLTNLIDGYIAMWNETDAERRRDLIARTWTEAASYLDPVMQGEGQAGIDAMVQGVQEGALSRVPVPPYQRSGRSSRPRPLRLGTGARWWPGARGRR